MQVSANFDEFLRLDENTFAVIIMRVSHAYLCTCTCVHTSVYAFI